MSIVSFVDNDVLLKLTAFELFWDAIALLGVQPKDVQVLATAQFVFRGSKALRYQYSDAVLKNAVTLVKSLTKVEADQTNPFLSLQAKDLDIGELTFWSLD